MFTLSYILTFLTFLTIHHKTDSTVQTEFLGKPKKQNPILKAPADCRTGKGKGKGKEKYNGRMRESGACEKRAEE